MAVSGPRHSSISVEEFQYHGIKRCRIVPVHRVRSIGDYDWRGSVPLATPHRRHHFSVPFGTPLSIQKENRKAKALDLLAGCRGSLPCVADCGPYVIQKPLFLLGYPLCPGSWPTKRVGKFTRSFFEIAASEIRLERIDQSLGFRGHLLIVWRRR